LFIAKGGGAAPWAPPAPCGLSELGSNLINLFRFESQPFQEALVAGWVAALEQFMPLFPFRPVQADLFEHRDPFFYVYMVLHIHSQLGFFVSVLFRHTHDEEKPKV
jgi:hypothetical protein